MKKVGAGAKVLLDAGSSRWKQWRVHILLGNKSALDELEIRDRFTKTKSWLVILAYLPTSQGSFKKLLLTLAWCYSFMGSFTLPEAGQKLSLATSIPHTAIEEVITLFCVYYILQISIINFI